MPDRNQLYIQLFNIHGLIRGKNPELGRDADTGGQTVYVLELAKALARQPGIRKVDLFTRYIRDKTVSPDYSQLIEPVDDKLRIVRIQCGGSKYIRKEMLWGLLDEYVDKTLKFIKDENDYPDIVHGHYADAGYVAKELSTFLGVPFVFTGHSLGRIKQSDLENKGMSPEEMDKKFNISHRIKTEEEIIANAELIVTSTSQEARQQYGKYDAGDNANLSVIPPGIDTNRFFPFYSNYDNFVDEPEKRDTLRQAQFFMQKELERFLTHPEKPFILTLARPDHRKNITGLVEAYGKDRELQAIANLAVFAGIRKDITAMDTNEQEVLIELLLLMDKYDLYGKLAIPKRHDVEYEVPELYRIAGRSQGLFANPAFKENFGVALIEASASGLPIVANDDGGPRDIVKNCENGVLVDITDHEQFSAAMRKILVDPEMWKQYSQNGINGAREHYSWDAHCAAYLEQLSRLDKRVAHISDTDAALGISANPFAKLDNIFISDIDDTLIGDDDALQELAGLIRNRRSGMGFGVATGRPVSSAKQVLAEHNVPLPDVIISSVGSEIYYRKDQHIDNGWRAHINERWDRRKIVSLLRPLKFLNYQDGENAQRDYKISYFMDENPDHLAMVHKVLTENRIRYTLIFSRGMFLDILPYRASKGKAIRYLSYKWNIPLNHILVAGDSDNDEDMLRGEMLGIVVGNHHPDLDKLRGLKNIYFAKNAYAAGILEGFNHYGFPKNKVRETEEEYANINE